LISNGGDSSNGEEKMSRRRPLPLGVNVLTIILYVLVAIIFLKLFKIIPDPPEIDFGVLIGITGLAISILTTGWNWLARRFTDIEDSLNKLEKNLQKLTERTIMIETNLKNMGDKLMFNERLVKLEELMKVKKK